MKQKILLFLVPIFFYCNLARAQDYRYVYYLDTHLGTVPKSKAVILGKGFKDNGLFRLDCFAITNNTLLMQAHFKDSSLSAFEGPYTTYHINGKVETKGNYKNALQDGLAEEWNEEGQKIDSTIYDRGRIIKDTRYTYNKNGGVSWAAFTDSLLDTYHIFYYNEHDSLRSEIIFKGQKGVIRTYTNAGINDDSVFTREEIDADFKGGQEAWKRFLMQNLDANVPVDNKAPAGVYTVVVKFIVKKDGTLSDIRLENDPGYGMGDEALRILKKSPKWVPARQYGRNVNAYRRQPFVFNVNDASEKRNNY